MDDTLLLLSFLLVNWVSVQQIYQQYERVGTGLCQLEIFFRI